MSRMWYLLTNLVVLPGKILVPRADPPLCKCSIKTRNKPGKHLKLPQSIQSSQKEITKTFCSLQEITVPPLPPSSISMSFTASSASEQNNLGVEFLQRGEYAMAMGLFRSALDEVRRDIRGAEGLHKYKSRSSSDTSCSPSSPSSVMECITKPAHKACHLLEGPSSRTGITNDHEDAIYYTQGLRMVDTPDGPCFSQDPVEEGKIRSSIVVFNLALVSQLSRQHAKAKSLYQSSYQLLSYAMESYQGRSTQNAFLDVICMAVLNNLAHASMECFEYEESKRMVSRLIRLALSVRSSAYYYDDVRTGVQLESFLRPTTESFLHNAAMVGLLHDNAAPAA